MKEHRCLRRYPLEQQRLHRLDSAIRMEAPAHDAAVQHVVYSHETHTLMMSHVRVNDHSLAALPFRLPRVVQRLIKAHASVHAGFFQTLEISNRFHGLDEQRQRGSVRRDDQIVLQPTFQAKRRNTESLILIDLVDIECAVS